MKILLIDIENTPNLGFYWDAKVNYIPHPMMVAEKKMLCFAAKWYGEPYTYWYKGEGMYRKASELMDKSDAIVHFNGLRHDIPILNQEMALRGLTPPPPSKHIDLYRTVRSQFKLYSNSLKYVLKYFGLPEKMDPGGMDTWLHITLAELGLTPKRNPLALEAWKVMEEYNRQDVEIMEPLYERLLPWIKNHPNLNLYRTDGEEGCPSCGSTNNAPQGYRYTAVGKYQRFRCSDCGRWYAGGKRLQNVEKRGF